LLSSAVLSNGYGTLEQVLAGIQWVLDPDGNPDTPDGAQIVNMSLGLSGTSSVLREAVNNMLAVGVLPICAVGNGGYYSSYSPGNVPDAVAVGAVDGLDLVPAYSAGGDVCWEDRCVTKPDLSAPGCEILGAKPEGSYQSMTGTSVAAPHVAGAAALLLQNRPDLGLSQLKHFLFGSSLDLGMPDFDDRYGHGRLDIPSAINFLDLYRPRFGSPELVIEQRPSRNASSHCVYNTYFSDGQNGPSRLERSALIVFSASKSSTIETLGIADFNGDGYADLLLRETIPQGTNGTMTRYKVYPSESAAGFSSNAEIWHSALSQVSNPPELLGLGDVDGDGMADVVLVERETVAYGERLHVFALLASGERSFSRSSSDWADHTVYNNAQVDFGLGDVNGDGRKDLVVVEKIQTSNNYYRTFFSCGISSGKNFGALSLGNYTYSPMLSKILAVSDVNGDKFEDLVLTTEGSSMSSVIHVMRSNGMSSFSTATAWASLDGSERSKPLWMADVDGDRAADLITGCLDLNSDYSSFDVWLSNRQTSFLRRSQPWFSRGDAEQLTNSKVIGIGDVGLGDWRQ
jgi:hypothetical protein